MAALPPSARNSGWLDKIFYGVDGYTPRDVVHHYSALVSTPRASVPRSSVGDALGSRDSVNNPHADRGGPSIPLARNAHAVLPDYTQHVTPSPARRPPIGG